MSNDILVGDDSAIIMRLARMPTTRTIIIRIFAIKIRILKPDIN